MPALKGERNQLRSKRNIERTFLRNISALTSFCEKSCGTSVAQMTEHSTGNQKDLGSIPSGVKAFLFSQKIFLTKTNSFAVSKTPMIKIMHQIIKKLL